MVKVRLTVNENDDVSTDGSDTGRDSDANYRTQCILVDSDTSSTRGCAH